MLRLLHGLLGQLILPLLLCVLSELDQSARFEMGVGVEENSEEAVILLLLFSLLCLLASVVHDHRAIVVANRDRKPLDLQVSSGIVEDEHGVFLTLRVTCDLQYKLVILNIMH